MRIDESAQRSAWIHGFPPVENPSARILILGSMPGAASLCANQYYAHPQNIFWRILGEILGNTCALRVDGQGADGFTSETTPTRTSCLQQAPYAEKLGTLNAADIALWDVLASCQRKGSLDSDIAKDAQRANDFAGFFASHKCIQRVLFNGAKAEACFRKHVAASLETRGIEYIRLPSTSPANASIPYSSKLAAWCAGFDLRTAVSTTH